MLNVKVLLPFLEDIALLYSNRWGGGLLSLEDSLSGGKTKTKDKRSQKDAGCVDNSPTGLSKA